jgi:hypothetical protein
MRLAMARRYQLRQNRRAAPEPLQVVLQDVHDEQGAIGRQQLPQADPVTALR